MSNKLWIILKRIKAVYDPFSCIICKFIYHPSRWLCLFTATNRPNVVWRWILLHHQPVELVSNKFQDLWFLPFLRLFHEAWRFFLGCLSTDMLLATLEIIKHPVLHFQCLDLCSTSTHCHKGHNYYWPILPCEPWMFGNCLVGYGIFQIRQHKTHRRLGCVGLHIQGFAIENNIIKSPTKSIACIVIVGRPSNVCFITSSKYSLKCHKP